MRYAHFYLKLSPDELLEYYQGHKRYVRVRTYEGYSIQFRAEHLRQWVKAYGINGEFRISFGDDNKFAGLALYRDYGSQSPSKSATNTPKNKQNPQGKSSVSTGPNQRPRGFKTSI